MPQCACNVWRAKHRRDLVEREVYRAAPHGRLGVRMFFRDLRHHQIFDKETLLEVGNDDATSLSSAIRSRSSCER